MSFEPPAGILDIGNATLRVGKLEVTETTGLNQGLQNIVKNDLLLTETAEYEYSSNKHWGLKLPTTWVAEFEVKGETDKYVEFNFYNEGSTSNAYGYTLNFRNTTLTLDFDNGVTPLATATIPTIVGTFRKVNIFLERGVIAVYIDGARVLYYKFGDSYNANLGVPERVISTTGSAFLNLFIEDNSSSAAFKNLRIVNGRFISDKTSNVSFIGSLGVGVNSPQEALDIRGNMHLTRVSNVSQVSVDSNVVTEYTGPHDRPLRKYPEVALSITSESASGENGYKVSWSSIYDNGNNVNERPFRVFDGDVGTGGRAWMVPVGVYGSDGTYVQNPPRNLGTATGGNSTTVDGEYIILQTPNKIKVKHFKISDKNSSGNTDKAAEAGKLYGSNDGSIWYELVSFSELSYSEGDNFNTVHVNATTYYDRLALVVTNSTATSSTYMSIGELEYYGYEEGSGSLDTTLKTVYNVPATTGAQLEVYYDAKNYTSGTITDESPNSYVGTLNGNTQLETVDGIKAFTFDGNGDTITGTVSGASGEYVHSIVFWVKFEDLVATGNQGYTLFEMGPRAQDEMIGLYAESDMINYYFYSNDNSYILNGVSFGSLVNNQWYQIAATYSGGSDISNRKIYINGNEITRTTHGGASSGPLSLTNGNFTIGDISGGGGSNDFKGSIANFRLYSKALNADQVKELYDYQKDYFLGSKSQVTLYKGHLGVGVTEPSGQLELAGDERLQEYPPMAMTGYETLIPGHGVFCASASSYYGSYYPWNAFDKNITDDSTQQAVWHTAADFTVTTPGIYNAGASLGGYTGAWLKLKLPYSIKPSKVSIHPRTYPGGTSDFDQNPKDFLILGSKDDNTWDVLSTQTDVVFGTTWKDFTLSPGNNTYNYFAISCTKIKYGAYFAINDMKYFGTPGPTTLDKGSLTLGRSLDVPRVSRYDMDTETPRPEKLVLDFDTTVNSSPTDISGKGNHGTFYSGAEYSEADKAFNFSGWSNDTPVGSEDWIQATATGTSGNFIHSVSMWVKSRIPDTSTTSRSPFHMGNAGTANEEMQIQFNYTNNIVYLGTQNGWLEMANMEDIIKQNQWHHIAYTYNGTNMLPANTKFYIDGKQMTMTNGSSSTLNFPSSTEDIFIGRFNSPTSANWWNGQISNFKLYNVALEPSEVKKLYNLGRTGRSMVISDTAVGIGKAPEAQLDVRGLIKAATMHVPGTVVQVQATVLTGDSSTADENSGHRNSFVKLNITPRFKNSIILLDFKFLAYFHNSTNLNNGVSCIIRRHSGNPANLTLTGTNVYIANGGHNLHYYTSTNVNGKHLYIALMGIDTPNTLEEIYYVMAFKPYVHNDHTVSIGNGSNQPTSVRLMEIAQ